MANKENERKQSIGGQGQGNTARTQDPTTGYGIEKEPMDHVKAQGEHLPRPQDAEPHPGNQGATEPMKHPRDEQRPFSPQIGQDGRSDAKTSGRQAEHRTGNQAGHGQQRPDHQAGQGQQLPGHQGNHQRIGQRHEGSSSSPSPDKSDKK